MGSQATKFTTPAGRTIFIKATKKTEQLLPGGKRAPKQNPTTAQVEEMNRRYAEKSLAMILNSNFSYGDYHAVFTYAGEEPTKEQAKRDRERFCRKLNKVYKDAGIPLKYVLVTEYSHKRIHHHVVLSKGINLIEIEKIWGKGRIFPRHLDASGDYRKLAAYLIKETSETFRDPDAVSRRRYSCSRTITRPETKKEDVSARILFEEPKPLSGYYIDQDSIVKGVNPVTNKPYLEYVMISLAEEPRIKKWNRGKKTKDTEGFDSWLKRHREKQEEIDLNPASAGEFVIGGKA